MAIETYNLREQTFYRVRVKTRIHGKQLTKTAKFSETGQRITNLRKAREIENNLVMELRSRADETTEWSWDTWLERAISMLAIEFKEKTVENYQKTLSKWVGDYWDGKQLESFSKFDIHEFTHEHLTNKGASLKIKKDVLRRVARVFELAVEEGILSKNPAMGLKVVVPEKEQPVLSAAEVEKLLSTARELSHPFYSHWALALLTGMRNGELYALRWSHIDLEKGVIAVTKQFTSRDGLHNPKRGRHRLVDINNSLRTFLKNLRASGAFKEKLWERDQVSKEKVPVEYDDLVLPRVRAWRLGQQAGELRAFCKKIGITSVKFHDLRATYITNLLTNGETLNRVMCLVGHKRLATTDRYNRLAGVDIKGASSKLGYEIPDDPLGKVIRLA